MSYTETQIKAARGLLAEIGSQVMTPDTVSKMQEILAAALDALERDQQEDAEDIADTRAALAEPGPNIPYEQVRRELGLDAPQAMACIAALESALTALRRFALQQGLGWQQRAEAAEAKVARVLRWAESHRDKLADNCTENVVAKSCARDVLTLLDGGNVPEIGSEY